MRRPSARGSLDKAERALASVADYPLQAEEAALAVLSDDDVEPEAASIAQRTLGLVSRETGRLAEARRRLRRAIAIAEAGGLEVRAVEARLSLVLVLLQGGYPAEARAELERASQRAPRELRGQVLLQRALIHIRTGSFDEALSDSRRALPLLRREGDRLNQARLLSNRGILHAWRNELGLAQTDLDKALELYGALGSEIAAAQVQHNLGYVLALRGDVPAALRHYDSAARRFDEQGLGAPALSIDRAELLLSARLLPEARREIDLGVNALEAAGNSLDLAEARLLLSQVALAQKDFAAAAAVAAAARHQFLRQSRSRWAVLARFVEAQSRWAGAPPKRVAAESGRLAVSLVEHGWRLPSLECRLIGARAALVAGDSATAAELVAHIERARSAPSAQRVRTFYGEALRRLAEGNRRGARSALRAGLAVAEDLRATLGATELRVRTATTVSELAELGLGLALASKSAAQVLRWSERWRAGALTSPRATPPRDEELARLLAALRDTVARLERADPSGEDLKALAGRQRRLEEVIRRHSHAEGSAYGPGPRCPSPAELQESLGERVLVEYLEHEGALYAVVADQGRLRLRQLPAVARAETERITLQFALGRLARHRSTRQSLDAAAALLERTCRRLSALLVEPLAADIDGRDLVVVPTGALHALPWSLLPAVRGRTTTVAPSATMWHARQAASSPVRSLAGGSGAVLVVGPRVVHGDAEVTRIRAACYPRARVLRNGSSTAGAVTSALEGRTLAHIAAHGKFRADNPQFSSLELADGPLTVYDLERIAHPPQWIVLSVCDAGRPAVHPGDELMGTSAALLALGTRAIVSSVAQVPDDGVTPVMVTLHTELAAGLGLAGALATAQARALPPELGFADLALDDPSAREALAAAAFVCLGAG